jgi:hypothetical protein
MKWYVVRTQKERKSVSEKIIKEGEIGEVGRSGQVLVPLEKDILSKDNKSTKRNNDCLVIFLCKQVH